VAGAPLISQLGLNKIREEVIAMLRRLKNEKGIFIPAIFIVTSVVVVLVAGSAIVSGKTKSPDFKAKTKTIDTESHPATPEWDR
jgi:hypothetical protein